MPDDPLDVDPLETIDLSGKNVQLEPEFMQWAKKRPFELYVRSMLISLVKRSDGASAVLPPQRIFAKELGIDKETLHKALYSLHEAGWIQITNLGGRRERLRIIVKHQVRKLIQIESSQFEELLEEVRELRKKIGAKVQEVADFTYSISDGHDKNVVKSASAQGPHESSFRLATETRELLHSISIVDKKGRSLSKLSDDRIRFLAKGASDPDIRAALLKLKSYTFPVTNVYALFSALFQRIGRQTRLKETVPVEYRNGMARSDLPENVIQEQKRAAGHLAERRWVRRGEINLRFLQYLRSHGALDDNRDERDLVRLKERVVPVFDDKEWPFRVSWRPGRGVPTPRSARPTGPGAPRAGGGSPSRCGTTRAWTRRDAR